MANSPIQNIWLNTNISYVGASLKQATSDQSGTVYNLTIVSDGKPQPAKTGSFPNDVTPYKIKGFNYKHTFTWLGEAGIDSQGVTDPSQIVVPEVDIGVTHTGAVIKSCATAIGAQENNDYKFNICYNPAKYGQDNWGGCVDKHGVYYYTNSRMVTAKAVTDFTYYHDDGHSKIIGVSYDGCPIYGPYGYSDPMDPGSSVVAVQSGFHLITLDRVSRQRPAVSKYPLGTFVQDYAFIGLDNELDMHNGRFCVTPDYPNGVYAYFMTIDAKKQPAYPYIIGPTFNSPPTYRPVPLTADQIYNNSFVPKVDVPLPHPVWISQGGSLGSYTDGDYFETRLIAKDPAGVGLIYTLMSGSAPSGVQLNQTSGVLAGCPVVTDSGSVGASETYMFTVRATNVYGYITDQSFEITISNISPPVIVPPGKDLGTLFDGSLVDLQLQAVELNPNAKLVWSLQSGTLPPGLNISPTGLLYGYLQPIRNAQDLAQVGWDNTGWELFPWSYNGRTDNQFYQFSLRVSDGNKFSIADYRVNVVSKATFTADSTYDFVNVTTLEVDANTIHKPVITTQQTSLPVARQQSYFAFKFDAIDFDGDDLLYTIAVANGAGFDLNGDNLTHLSGVGFDTAGFDESTSILPPGLGIDGQTGWLTGFLGTQTEISKEYTFKVSAYKRDNPTYVSDAKVFTLTILNSLNNEINWVTPSNLGIILSGETSTFKVEATSPGRKITYRLKSGAANRLPQGTKLLNNGLLVGRPTFRQTTFDNILLNFTTLFDGFSGKPTLIDTQYRFTVEALTTDGVLQTEKEFVIQVNRDVSGVSIYENLYLKALPSPDQRGIFESIVANKELFPDELIYRSEDPYFGKAKNISFLFVPGLTPSTALQYLTAMQHNFYTKTINFGNIKTAIAKDSNLNTIYEVVYVELEEDDQSASLVSKQLGGRNPYYDEDGVPHRTIYPNSLHAWRERLNEYILYKNRSALPPWMTSTQTDGRTLGLTYGVVLAYTIPGASNLIAYRLKDNNITFSNIEFKVDRFVWDKSLTRYLNLAQPADTNPVFIKTKETLFDRLISEGTDANALANAVISDTAEDLTAISTDAGTVNYAVTVGFNDIHNKDIMSLLFYGEPRAYAYNVTWGASSAIGGTILIDLPVENTHGPIISGDIIHGEGVPYGASVTSYDGQTLIIGLSIGQIVAGQYTPTTLTFSQRGGIDGVTDLRDGDTLIFANQNHLNTTTEINVESEDLFDDELYDQGPTEQYPNLTIAQFDRIRLIPQLILNSIDPWSSVDPAAVFDQPFDMTPLDNEFHIPGYRASTLNSQIPIPLPPVDPAVLEPRPYSLAKGDTSIKLYAPFSAKLSIYMQLYGYIDSSTGIPNFVKFYNYYTPLNPMISNASYNYGDSYFTVELNRGLPAAVPVGATLVFRELNQRAGVWKLRTYPRPDPLDPLNPDKVTATIALQFVKEIQPGQVVTVLSGESYGSTRLVYNSYVEPGNTEPDYTLTKLTLTEPGKYTKFDGNGTRFFSNVDQFAGPEENAKYIIFPYGSKSGVFK